MNQVHGVDEVRDLDAANHGDNRHEDDPGDQTFWSRPPGKDSRNLHATSVSEEEHQDNADPLERRRPTRRTRTTITKRGGLHPSWRSSMSAVWCPCSSPTKVAAPESGTAPSQPDRYRKPPELGVPRDPKHIPRGGPHSALSQVRSNLKMFSTRRPGGSTFLVPEWSRHGPAMVPPWSRRGPAGVPPSLTISVPHPLGA